MADGRWFVAGWGLAWATFVVGCDPPERESGQWPIALGVLVASKEAAPASDPGEAPYRRTCIACHGSDGRGNGQKTGADFTRPDGVLTRPDAELLVSIRNGKQGSIGVMPAHRLLLSESETVAVLAYVRKTFGANVAVTAPGASAATSGSAASAATTR